MRVTANSQLPLFQYSSLPTWLPGETLFSLSSRYHFRSGNRVSTETARQLYGAPRSGLQHDFPSRLQLFCERTQGAYGDADTVIWGHTLLPFYLRLLEQGQAAAILSMFRNGPTSQLKARLGLLSSGFRANHPLKACPACMEADRWRYGVAYWRLDHQPPAVWVCLLHDEFLLECDVKANGVDRFAWHLPDTVTFVRREIQLGVKADLKVLATFGTGLLNLPKLHLISPGRLRSAYREGLAAVGLLTPKGSIRLDVIGPRYLELCRTIAALPAFYGLPRKLDQAKLQIGNTLRGHRVTHPVRHLLAAQIVFGSWSRLITALHGASEDVSRNPNERTDNVDRLACSVRMEGKRRKWRRVMLEMLQQRPCLTRSQIHRQNPAAYSWLIRHDRRWLQQHLPSKLAPKRRNPSISWSERDRQLALEIHEMAPRVAARYTGMQKGRWMLAQAIPQLGAKLSQLNRLPQTRNAITAFLVQ